MAVQPYAKIDTKWGGYPAFLYRWTLNNADTGAPVRIPPYSDITVQVRGTLASGAGAVQFEGTLNDAVTPAAADYGVCHKTDLTNCTTSVTGTLMQILEHPLQVRPNCTQGDGGTSAICEMLVVKQWKE